MAARARAQPLWRTIQETLYCGFYDPGEDQSATQFAGEPGGFILATIPGFPQKPRLPPVDSLRFIFQEKK
jgi:hypothetical protein